MTLEEIDAQIHEVENRIAIERIALNDAVSGCTHSLREMVTSPKTLLALLGVGYALGKVVFKGKTEAPSSSAPAKTVGVLGLLTGVAGTALSLSRPGLGWGSVARWAAGRYLARRKTKAAPPVAPARSQEALPITSRPSRT